MSTLFLTMNNQFVGELIQRDSGALSFRYHKSWLQKEGARPISLSLPLSETEYSGNVVANFFDNLLPDNPQIKVRIQKMLQTASSGTFDLLSVIGKDCVGAIQLMNKKIKFSKTIQADPLSKKEIAFILKHYKTLPLGMRKEETEFRISVAGTQQKSSFLKYKNKWHLPLGSTPASHIFKLPIGFIEHQNIDLSDSCENEWLCTEITKAFGLPVASTKIENFEDVKVLIVERFDRQWSKNKSWLMRLPQEDCCQALGYSPHVKYESDGGPGIQEIMKLLLGSRKSMADQEYFFRSQVLFFLLGAIDGHAKNFSLFIEPYGDYCLTRLYDILSAYPLIAKKQLQIQKIKLAMALIGKNNHYHWNEIRRRHFISTAKATKFSKKKAEEIIDDMLSKVDTVIAEVSENLPKNFPKLISKSIFDGIKTAKMRLYNRN